MRAFPGNDIPQNNTTLLFTVKLLELYDQKVKLSLCETELNLQTCKHEFFLHIFILSIQNKQVLSQCHWDLKMVYTGVCIRPKNYVTNLKHSG